MRNLACVQLYSSVVLRYLGGPEEIESGNTHSARPSSKTRARREGTSETLILSSDFASTIWMAGGGAVKKPGEEHALVVSHKFF